MTDLCKTELLTMLDTVKVKQKDIAEHIGISEDAMSKRKKTEKGRKEVDLLTLAAKVKKLLGNPL